MKVVEVTGEVGFNNRAAVEVAAVAVKPSGCLCKTGWVMVMWEGFSMD